MLSELRRGAWLMPGLAGALLLVSAGPAGASCAPAIPIEQALTEAQTVFVGVVTDLEFGGRVATFRVEDVWKGEVGPTAVVNGGPSLSELEAAKDQGQDVVTSVDRSYDMDERYLVVSHGKAGEILSDNVCSVTQQYTSDLDRHRPASAFVPVVQPDDKEAGPGRWFWLGLIALGAGVVGSAATAAARRRGRQSPSPFSPAGIR